MWVRSLRWEGPQEEEKATHSSILTWKIPWTDELGGLQSLKLQKSRTCLSTHGGIQYIFIVIKLLPASIFTSFRLPKLKVCTY